MNVNFEHERTLGDSGTNAGQHKMIDIPTAGPTCKEICPLDVRLLSSSQLNPSR